MAKLPDQLQFQGSAESRGFRPIQQASPTAIVAQNADALNASLERNGQIGTLNIERKYRNVGKEWEVLANFSNTLGKRLEEIDKQTQEDIETGAQYDYLMQGFDDSVPANSTPEQRRLQSAEADVEQAANVGGDAAARFSNEVETRTGDPVIGTLAWQRTGGLARGFRAQEAVLMGARSSYSGFLAAYLQSGASIRVNGQEVSVSEAVNSGDPALTNAAITAARFQFIRQNGLHLATKDAFIKHFAPTMLATEGAISGQLVLGAIKGQRESRQQELEGLGYDLSQNISPGEIGTAFESLSRQFYQGGLGISRGQANELAVKTLIAGLEDKGDVDSLRGLLDVQQVPGQAGTELRRRFGNEINDALRRAEGRQDEIQQREAKDIESSMYQDLAGATTQDQRDAIIERYAVQLESVGLYREARQLRQERDELSVDGANELNAARMEAAVRNGTATSEEVEQSVLRGDITREQASRILRDTGVTERDSIKDDIKNPLYKGIEDSWGDRIENEFLNRVGIKRDVYGRLIPGQSEMVTEGEAEILRQQMRNDIKRVTEQSLLATVGQADGERQRHLQQALKDWHQTNFNDTGGKFHVPEQDKGGRIKKPDGTEGWNPAIQTRLRNLTNSPVTLSVAVFPRGVKPFDWSGRVNGTTVPSDVRRWFRRLRGDKLFDEQTINILRDDFERNGNVQQGLQNVAQQLGMSPLALLNQQIAAYGQQPLSTPSLRVSGDGGGVDAPMTAVQGANQLMSLGFPAKGAAWLAGNIQQESGWNGQRQPWDDNGAFSGGLPSWRAGRLTAAANATGGGNITRASNQAQLRYMVQEMRDRYPEAHRIFMNPRSTDRQLIRASQIYWGYGEEGRRFEYARGIESQLRGTSNNAAPTAGGSGSQRAVQVGRQLLGRGIRMWQNSSFDLDRGHVGSGGRVGAHSPNSYHYSNQALDIPLSHNSTQKLGETFAYLQRNMRRLGIVELFYDAGGYYRDGKQIGRPGSNTIPGHTGHIHVAFG